MKEVLKSESVPNPAPVTQRGRNPCSGPTSLVQKVSHCPGVDAGNQGGAGPDHACSSTGLLLWKRDRWAWMKVLEA